MIDQKEPKTTGFKATSIEELTVEKESFGQVIRKQISKYVLSRRGIYVDIMFVYKEYSFDKNCFDKERVMLATFKSQDGYYVRNSYFVIDKEDLYEILNVAIQDLK